MKYYENELAKSKGPCKFRFFWDHYHSTNYMNLNLNSIAALEKFIEQKKIEIEREMYLDYINNFITISQFARHYSISSERAKELIKGQREKEEK